MDTLLPVLLRGVLLYLYLLAIVRMAGKRTLTEATPLDLVVALIVGDFPDDIIWGEVPVAQGLVAIGTVVGLHLAVVDAAYRSARLDRLVGSAPTPVLRDGRLLRDGLAAERVNELDLAVALRGEGLRDRDAAAEILVEPGGVMSVRRQTRTQPADTRDLPALVSVLR